MTFRKNIYLLKHQIELLLLLLVQLTAYYLLLQHKENVIFLTLATKLSFVQI